MKIKFFTLFLLSFICVSFLVGEVPLPKLKSSPSPFDKTVPSSETPPFKSTQSEENKSSPPKEGKKPTHEKSNAPKFYNPFLKKAPSKSEASSKKKTLVPSYRSKSNPSSEKKSKTPPPFIESNQSTDAENEINTGSTHPYIIQEAKPENETAAPKDSSYKPPKLTGKSKKSEPVKIAHKKKIKGSSEEGYTINFNKISIIEFLRFIGEIAKVNFIFHEDDLISKNSGKAFTITLVSEEPTRISDIMTVLLQTLQSHGLSLSERGDNIVIFKSTAPSKLARVVTKSETGQEEYQIPIITRIFSLKASSAPEIASIIKSLLSKNAQIQVSTPTNQIIVTDLSQNIKRIEDLIQALDKPFGGLELGKYVAETTIASELVSVAQKILLPLSDGKPLILVPHNTSDSIFIVASPSLIDKTIKVLAALDIGTPISNSIYEEEVPSASTKRKVTTQTEITTKTTGQKALDKSQKNTTFRVHKLRHHKGNAIASSLNEIGLSLQGISGKNTELASAISSIRWIPSSNSLIITGTPQAVNQVQRLVESLDSPLRQVFIEMLILETSVQQSFGFGVQWGITGRDSQGRFAGASAADTVPQGGDGIINMINNKLPTLPAGFGLGVIGDLIVHNGQPLASFGALINAIESDTETSILMNPRLITQDAKSAELFVGVNIPYKSATIQPNLGEATTEFEYRNVGTRLVVTPYLGNSDLITLEISQNISEVAANQSNDQTLLSQNTPKSTTTSTHTTVHVPDNHFLMISGMIRSSTVKATSGLPCMGGIPFLSDVTGSKSFTKQKTNIIIFIRPHVINSEKEVAEFTKEQNELFEKQKTFNSFEKDKDEIFNVMDMYNY
jgi:type III secretion protein C